jgi:predicted Rdx family selenoprotein
VLPLLLTLASTLITLLDIDRHLADALYTWQGGTWALKNAWITETVLHTGAREATKIAGILFHTVLGMLNVESSVYDAHLDIVQGCRSQEVLAQRVRNAIHTTAQNHPVQTHAIHDCTPPCNPAADRRTRGS